MGFGGVASFTQLSDTPRTYAGQALKALGVKADENGLEFAAGVPPLDLGAGFNFLKVSQVGGQPFAGWVDIQDLIIALTGALNRIVTPPELVAPVPVASQVALAPGAPPGLTAVPGLAAPVPIITASTVIV
ncbi:hypothetical protein ACFLX9_04080 [Chloroflexota bacterium]